MDRELHWYDYLTINAFWLGINVSSGIITPVLLPYLVALFVPADQKNTYLAILRVITLAVAMMVQPMAGLLSDRSTLRWGRRRPFIVIGTIFNLIFLAIIGASPQFQNVEADHFFQSTLGVSTAYFVLLVGVICLQISANVAHGAMQGLIPDLVPEDKRGRASGVKSVMELLPVALVIFVGPLIDSGRIWLTVGIIGFAFAATMLITVLFVDEEPREEKPDTPLLPSLARFVGLALIFVTVTQGAVWLVRLAGDWITARNGAIAPQVAVIGTTGLLGMAGAVFLGVYLGAWIGIGKGARQHTSFIWWVINRLLFLAALVSIQSFAQYYLADVLEIPNAASVTTILLGVVALFLIPSALGGGYLADRIGRKRLVMAAGLTAGVGAVVLLLAPSLPVVIVSGCIIGLGGGTFMATNWALGTDLVPAEESGRYLGISNLAGAGAGIVGTGIGGPMADALNAIQPGLGYLTIFAIYAALFVLSALVLSRVETGALLAGAE